MPIAAVAIWSLVLFGSYRYAERVFLLLTVVFIAYPIAAVLAHPNWHQVAVNTVWPHFVASKSFLLLSVALIGTTITPVHPAVRGRRRRRQRASSRRNTAINASTPSPERSLASFVAMSIIVATGATIGGSGPLTSATTAAQALKPVAGAAAETLFGLGLLGASALAAAVVPLSTSYAVAEAIGVERSVSSSFRQAPVFLGIFTFQIVAGAAVVLVPGNLITLILNTQVLEGVITPMTLILILILANRRSLLGSASNGPVSRWVGGLAIVSVAAVASRVRAADRPRLVRARVSGLRALVSWRRLRRSRAFGEAMRPCWVELRHPLPKTPRQKWIETKDSWERSRHVEVPDRVPAAPPRPGGRRIAFLIYRGNPRCGGQGVYTRHLTRELVALGHSVEVFSGPPWPELDPGVGFTPVPEPRPLPRPRSVPGAPPPGVPLA